MGIYLAWSVYKLLGVLMLIGVLFFYLNKHCKTNWKYILLPLLVVVMLAFNIGERQQHLNRSSFNNKNVEVIDKVEVDVLDSSTANKQYKESFNKGE